MTEEITPNPTVAITLTKERMEIRLADLRREFTAGQQMLTDLQTKQNNLQATLLRISGAIQVLEEMTKE